jgi:hypothetical protein
MQRTVQARLDRESQLVLARLVRNWGWSPSRVVREGLRLLSAAQEGTGKKVVGVGKFSSGIPDLGSNKKHLRGFGR